MKPSLKTGDELDDGQRKQLRHGQEITSGGWEANTKRAGGRR